MPNGKYSLCFNQEVLERLGKYILGEEDTTRISQRLKERKPRTPKEEVYIQFQIGESTATHVIENLRQLRIRQIMKNIDDKTVIQILDGLNDAVKQNKYNGER